MADHNHGSSETINLSPDCCYHDHNEPWWPLVIAIIAALVAEIAHLLAYDNLFIAGLAIIAILFSGIETYKNGLQEILRKQLNINALMTIAVTGAALIGQWPEAAMVMVLYTIAERIEHLSLERAHKAIQTLLQLSPATALIKTNDGSWQETTIKDIAIGTLIRTRPGERIALDGEIMTGASSIDQSPITGESMPIEKTIGDTVYAGTINGTGLIEYQATANAASSTLARIIKAVESAQKSKAPTERLIDRFSKLYTPIVVILAIIIALIPPLFMQAAWYDSIYKALVLLVIACPCALVISTPVSIVSALANAARNGVLVKGGIFIELGKSLNWLALDKTGTITKGQPELTDKIIIDYDNTNLCHSLAWSLAQQSDHPVSKAISKGIKPATNNLVISNFKALLGLGIQAEINGKNYVLANHKHIHDSGLCSIELENQLNQLEKQGKTVVLLADKDKVCALYAVADTIKDESVQAISELHKLGIKTAILSGDNQHTVSTIAQQAGIDEAYGDQLPENKLQALELQAKTGKVIGMVGDGINDAPALARADIGFAMASIGTDTAIETANVAIMDDDLRKIPWFIKLSKTTHKVLLQNFTIALGLKLIFVILTVMNLATMWMAVFADVGASLIVIFNGLRLLHANKQ